MEKTVSKQLTSKAGITVPKDIRSEAGWFPKMAVDIKMVDGDILISKHVLTCKFCGTIKNVSKILGIEICPRCATLIYEGVQKK